MAAPTRPGAPAHRSVLADSPLFSSLGESMLLSLESGLERVRLRGGDTLFRAGEPGDALYLVIYGRLRAVILDGDGDPRVLGEIGRGETVGEMAVLTGEPRSATVCAIRDAELLKLSRSTFERLMFSAPGVTLELTRLIIDRYRKTIESPQKLRLATLAVVPFSSGVPVRDFSGRLVDAISQGRRVLHLRRETVEPMLRAQPAAQSDAARESEFAGWLHEQESQHDYVVYDAEPEPSAWTEICLRQADTVLPVGRGTGAGEVRPDLLRLLERTDSVVRPRLELILLHEAGKGAPYSGAKEWLELLGPDSHHHIDLGSARDFDRLARLLTGQAIGLVLGGGGARGLAHIGVIRALEEAGIPIDLVGGTSIGAIIGAQYACGWSPDRMVEESRRAFLQSGRLMDYTVPVMALCRGKRYMRLMQSLFGEHRIEDLPLSYYCVTTNLTRGEAVVHRSGPLWRWVLASMAVPGLGPPVWYGRDLLVDGGVLNILPADVMRAAGRGPVLASSVSRQTDFRLQRDYPLGSPSPLQVLLSWMKPNRTPTGVPSIVGVLTRLVSLPQLATNAQVKASADLLFEPPVAGYKMLEWSAIDELVDIGYRSAVASIEEWRKIGAADSAVGG